MTRSIICDLDGCLANDSERWRRAKKPDEPWEYVHYTEDSSFDWDTYFNHDLILEDGVNEDLKQNLLRFYSRGWKIFYLTGRPEKIRHSTEQWLESNELSFHENLGMRLDNDFRPTETFKIYAIQKWQNLHEDYEWCLGFTDQPADLRAYEFCDIPGILWRAYVPGES